jgi:hypothetical protein
VQDRAARLALHDLWTRLVLHDHFFLNEELDDLLFQLGFVHVVLSTPFLNNGKIK